LTLTLAPAVHPSSRDDRATLAVGREIVEVRTVMIFDLTLLLLCQLVGEALAFWSGLPIPGPVLGLVALVILLVALGRAPSSLEGTATGLLQHLSLLFVPAGVGVMVHATRIAAEWPAILAALVISTWLTMAATALTMAWCARRMHGAAPERVP
jgi:holin-like protein